MNRNYAIKLKKKGPRINRRAFFEQQGWWLKESILASGTFPDRLRIEGGIMHIATNKTFRSLIMNCHIIPSAYPGYRLKQGSFRSSIDR